MKHWYDKYLALYGRSLAETDPYILQTIRKGLARQQSDAPVITLSVIAYNEERHLLACLWALSEMNCNYPVEIIGVDNDSTDRTADVFKACGLPFYTETQHSCGHARLCGLNHAKGKYHINIDADTLYPPRYAQIMVESMEKENAIAVCSSWSYWADEQHTPFSLWCYETARDIYLWMQHFKRPELSVRGLVFAYRTQPARSIGIRTDIIRGEDGSLALQLKKMGRILFIHNAQARAVTGYGTMGSDGTLWQSFSARLKKYLCTPIKLFTSQQHYNDEDSNLTQKK